MEEKKIDIQSIIGFILIGGILIWMLYTNPKHVKHLTNQHLSLDLTFKTCTKSNKCHEKYPNILYNDKDDKLKDLLEMRRSQQFQTS